MGPLSIHQKEGFSQKQGVLTFGATFFHWEHPEIVWGSSKESKSVGEVQFCEGVDNDGALAPRVQCLHFGENTFSTFGLIYVETVIFRAKHHRDELVQNLIF